MLGEFTPWDPASGAPRPPYDDADPLAHAAWDASWFLWTDAQDPRGDLEAWRSLRFQAVRRATVRAWRDPWGGAESVREAVGAERFGLHANATIVLAEAGTWRLRTRSDDGLRLTIDGVVVSEEWTWHPTQAVVRELELAAGRHEVELEYFQIDGAAELTLELDRAE
ncbi:MAG: hypothetical protein H6828_09650 [Planctomycetes bacterium]|nr:hypothetical protein [Planctomycetota bacterium]